MTRVFVLYLISLTLRSVLLAGFARLLLMRTQNVALRHAVWTLLLGCIFLMPLADALLPPVTIQRPAPSIALPLQTFVFVTQTTRPANAVYESGPNSRSFDPWSVAAFAVVGIGFALVIRFVASWRTVRRIKRQSERIFSTVWDEVRHRYSYVSLRQSSETAVPLTVGLLRPFVILPTDWVHWDDRKLRSVLVHELTHVSRHDWAVTFAAVFAKCIFWFNPLTWWLERHLSTLAELASDEACVRSSGDPRGYAATLLEFAAAARNGNRWLGGVAMAQHKITTRIERVLRLERPGSGILSRAGWAVIILVTLPALYTAAAARLSPPELVLAPAKLVQQLPRAIPVPPAAAIVTRQAPQQRAPEPQAPTPALALAEPAPAAPQGVFTRPQDPDLVGEIRLILTPVDAQIGNQPFSLTLNIGYSFTLMDVRDRSVSFENGSGGSFSYGCADCSFLVWESGVGLPAANSGPGVIFQLSADGKSLGVTCRATVCRIAAGMMPTGTFSLSRTLRDKETATLGVSQTPNNASSGLRCFSVFGNVKADGTPFTDADCLGGRATMPTTILFAVEK